MDALQLFANPDFGNVRALSLDGAPWFVGKDVALALGYRDTVNALKSHVDNEDKRGWRITTPSGTQEMTIINESGLYSLVLSSKLPTAKQFKRWVTSEVLPSIRKHGGYLAGQEALSPQELMAKALQVAQRTLDEREARIQALEAQSEADRPKVAFADAVAAADTSILVGEMAKILAQNGVPNMGQNRFFRWLREHGYLIRGNRSDAGMPTQWAVEKGLFAIKERPIPHNSGLIEVKKTIKITPAGQQHFISVFLAQAEGA